MQGMPAYVSSIAPLALLLPINCRVENILLQAFPLTTPVWEPGTVDICVERIWQLKRVEAWLWHEPFQEQHLDSWLTSWLISCLRQDANLDKCTKHKGRAGQRLGHLFWFKNSEANPKHIGRKAVTLKLNWKVLPPDVCLADYCLGWVSACPCSKAAAAISLTQIGEFEAQTQDRFWCIANSLAQFTGTSVSKLLWCLQSPSAFCLPGWRRLFCVCYFPCLCY